MGDAEYLFNLTSSERKRIGRGAYNKKRGGGKTVRLSTDHMTEKERRKMDGEVKSYPMNKPVRYVEIVTWPVDLQRQYFMGLGEKYGPRSKDLQEMLGCSSSTFSIMMRNCGLNEGRRKQRPHKTRNPEGWKVFLAGNASPERITPATEPEKAEDPATAQVRTSEPEPAQTSDPGKETGLNVLALASLFDSLRGSGAKISIEITL